MTILFASSFIAAAAVIAAAKEIQYAT